MHAGVLRQLVGHEDPHPVALHHFDGGARALPVVTPHIGFESRCHLAHHRLGHKVELLDAVVHPPGQRPAVQRDHRVVGTAGARHQRGHGVWTGLQHGFWQCCHGHTADAGCGNSTGHCGSGAIKKIASIHESFLEWVSKLMTINATQKPRRAQQQRIRQQHF